VAAGFLQTEHDGSQFPGINFPARWTLADISVLAILTSKVTPREEDRSRTSPTAKGIFFSVMWTV
jgi:hypothetical protein